MSTLLSGLSPPDGTRRVPPSSSRLRLGPRKSLVPLRNHSKHRGSDLRRSRKTRGVPKDRRRDPERNRGRTGGVEETGDRGDCGEGTQGSYRGISTDVRQCNTSVLPTSGVRKWLTDRCYVTTGRMSSSSWRPDHCSWTSYSTHFDPPDTFSPTLPHTHHEANLSRHQITQRT